MKVIRWIEKLWERFNEWLGLVADYIEDPAPDPLISRRPSQYDHSKHRPLDVIFDELRARENCPHWSAAAVDVAVPEADRVFHCRDCGLTYRHKIDPAKPWLIVGCEPVEATS